MIFLEFKYENTHKEKEETKSQESEDSKSTEDSLPPFEEKKCIIK